MKKGRGLAAREQWAIWECRLSCHGLLPSGVLSPRQEKEVGKNLFHSQKIVALEDSCGVAITRREIFYKQNVIFSYKKLVV